MAYEGKDASVGVRVGGERKAGRGAVGLFAELFKQGGTTTA
ncbi:MAG: hypothetical protein Greene07147_58 [Parcubacteria group bacterium Greene0714_7]|nr:MAG: hypothetical protein Greene07147_58 [Parcubacteria group bacterium Greene0714_7]